MVKRSNESPKTIPRRHRSAKLHKPFDVVINKYPFLRDFFALKWKKISQRNAFPIYALCLYANYSDYFDVASDALTEGDDDKDIDFCRIDLEEGAVFVGQSYLADEWDKQEAPANKAEDILTGLTWLLKPELDEIPPSLREKAREIQDGIRSGELTEVHLMFVHNCQNSDNVQKALGNVERAARVLIPNAGISVKAIEIGLSTIQRHYDSLTKAIVVEHEVAFDVRACFEEQGDEEWRAVSTTISGERLHELFGLHGNDLFSANLRGFLNRLNNKKSINAGIMETITQEPLHFWVYNNGITILTKRIVVEAGTIRALGVSIINGAQTTGVIGNASPERAKCVRIPCRFVECRDDGLIKKIIKKNNTQNEIRSVDVKSTDRTQRRICEEFRAFGIDYVHRREGTPRLADGTIQAETLAPYLAAFHGHFQTATRNRRSIFEDDEVYGKVFPRGISAEHIYLVQSLADALSELKVEVKDKKERKEAGKVEQAIHEMLQHSTSKFFIIGIVGELRELILGKAVPSRAGWIVSAQYVKPERTKVITAWKLALEPLISLTAAQVGNGSSGYDTVRSAERLSEVADKVSFAAHAIRR